MDRYVIRRIEHEHVRFFLGVTPRFIGAVKKADRAFHEMRGLKMGQVVASTATVASANSTNISKLEEEEEDNNNNNNNESKNNSEDNVISVNKSNTECKSSTGMVSFNTATNNNNKHTATNKDSFDYVKTLLNGPNTHVATELMTNTKKAMCASNGNGSSSSTMSAQTHVDVTKFVQNNNNKAPFTNPTISTMNNTNVSNILNNNDITPDIQCEKSNTTLLQGNQHDSNPTHIADEVVNLSFTSHSTTDKDDDERYFDDIYFDIQHDLLDMSDEPL